jgi:diguanylate cyclase (GGDEF)-like protein/PAS domain S-box-containing protein
MSLLNKISLFTLLITGLFITVVLNIMIENERTSRLTILEDKRTYNEKVYKEMLSSLLFDFNKSNITITLEALYHDIDIVKVDLIDYSNVINIKLNDKKFNESDLIKSRFFLEYNDNLVGELNITYTTRNIEEFLDNFKNKIIITSLSLMFLLLLILFYYINYVTKSLKELANATKDIADGKLTVNIDIKKSNDEIGALISNFRIMVTSIKEYRSNFEQQLKFQHVLLESMNMPVYIKDLDGKYINCNKSFADFFGKTKEEIIGKDMTFLLSGKLLEEQQEGERKLLQDGGSITYENSFTNAKGEKRDLVQFKTTYEEEDTVKWVIATYFDITEINAARKKIGIFSQAIRQSPVSIIITDTNANIEYVNEFFEQLSGFSLNEVKGKKPNFLELNIVSPKKYDEIWESINNRGVWEGEIQIRKKNGELYWEYIYFSTILNEDNNLINYLAVKEDITLKKEQEDRLQYQASYDMLTNLPNRTLFNDRLAQTVKENKRHHSNFAVLFIDLDNFKKVNDTLGHDFGDKILVETAKRLTNCLRDEDTISRFGGDEFIILLSELNKIENISLIVNKVLNIFTTPFIIDGNKLTITTSIGITTNLDNPSNNIQNFLRNADIAMYKAKDNGKNTFVYFNEKLNSELLRKIQIEKYMEDALDRNEFEVYFQAKTEISNTKIVGAEALIRWHNPNLKFISPEEFIPIAEQTGLIISIGEFVIKKSIELIVSMKEEFDIEICIAVNVSPRQLLNENIIEFIKTELLLNNVKSELLEIEITEGVLISKDVKVENRLQEFKDLGLSLALDDFGTGYSSLSYLRKYPFNIIKIDKSFIDAEDYTLVNTIISMSQVMNLKVVAEGVETKEQLSKLRELKCDIAQGYYFSKPIPKKDFLIYLSNNLI